ncbi:MAG: hypothetical protein JXB26_02635 [Candidatus Aminicenantes bacterium]|nr:hypothetical protein [Candidatus Aminicenantes bacterium]
MKKWHTVVLVSAFFMGMVIQPASGQTVEDILKKMIEVQGGRKTYESIKDMTVTGTIDIIQQGLTGEVTIYKKEPDKRRSDFSVMGMVITQAYNGKTAWGTNMQTLTNEELTGSQEAELRRNSMPIVAILDPEKYGISYTFKGKETVEDKEYLVLEQKYSDDFTVLLYVDPETYLTHRQKATVESELGTAEVEQVLSDFRKENGMMMAHTILTYQDGVEYMQITFDAVQFNTGLEDSLFEMDK